MHKLICIYHAIFIILVKLNIINTIQNIINQKICSRCITLCKLFTTVCFVNDILLIIGIFHALNSKVVRNIDETDRIIHYD